MFSAAIAVLLLGHAVRAATYTVIDVPDATDNYAQAINDDQTIAGQYRDANGYYHGFLRSADGALARFGPKHAQFVFVSSINSKRAAAGWLMTADN